MAEPRRLTINDIKGTDVRNVKVVPWPGTDGKLVGVLELRCSEVQAAYFAAREVFSRKGFATVDKVAETYFEGEFELQCVARMLIDPEARTPKGVIFATADEARARLDVDERGFFAGVHGAMQAEKTKDWTPETQPETSADAGGSAAGEGA